MTHPTFPPLVHAQHVTALILIALYSDHNRSIVMTTCSSVAALAMMPLLLYIFSRGIDHLEAAVPYTGIMTALVLTLVPCAIGILINHHRPKYAALVKKVRLGRHEHPKCC